MSDTTAFAERLEFLGMDSAAIAVMREMKPAIMAALPDALDRFYATLMAHPETRKYFPDEARAGRARMAQQAHWEKLSDGSYDETYAAAMTKIGQVHARTGLEPRWYIGGYALLLEELMAGVLKSRSPKRGFMRRQKPDFKKISAELCVLVKAVFLDIDLVTEVYLEAVDQARKALEAETKLASDKMSAAFGNALRALALGDLTHQMHDDMPAEYVNLRQDYHAAMLTLAGTMTSISSSAEVVRSGAEEITRASDDLSRRTEQQAASLEQTAAALDEITATVRRSAENATSASNVVAEARAEAEHSGTVVRQAVAAMTDIEKSSREIGNIIGTIDEIAFQTNLLALNAGIEAARAGDAGKGFAVVATEVRALAQRSADAAKEIKALISASGALVNSGVDLVGKTGEALGRIVGQVVKLNDLVSDMASSAQQQAASLHQVNTAVTQMDQVTQQNAAMVEQSTAAAHSLSAEAMELAKATGKFETGQSAHSTHQAGIPRKSPQLRAVAAAKPAKPAAPRPQPVPALTADDWTEF